MTATAPPFAAERSTTPTAPPPPGPGSEFDLYVIAAIISLREQVTDIAELASDDGPFPFLRDYLEQLPSWARDPSNPPASVWERWRAEVEALERASEGHLPVAALRYEGGFDYLAMILLFLAGLADEDPRFGRLFRAIQSDHDRPTVGLLSGWAMSHDDRLAARAAVARLRRLGVLQVVARAADTEQPLAPSPAIWEALRGVARVDIVDWAAYRPPRSAEETHSLVLADDPLRQLERIPDLVRRGLARTIVVRGPWRSGRGTALASIARALNYGSLELALGAVEALPCPEVGPLAAVLRAMPLIRVEPEPGEVVEVPRIEGYAGPIGVIMPRHGAVLGPDLEHSVTVTLGPSMARERRRHWLASLGTGGPDVDEMASAYRLSGGNIRRAATLARSAAALDGRSKIEPDDVRDAARELRARELETLAPRLPVTGDWSDLVADDDTRLELLLLEDRCRAREALLDALPAAIAVRSIGVKALFTGPSGTGKTLAVRLLASVLGLDLHVVQLATIVDKYLGETEKNLTNVFSRAAELDAVLLIDEGDALLTERTDVRTSNDRYANLQTNHLLQVLESHDGIVIVTTNAGDRIDSAFTRRMDATIEFRPPDAAQRRSLWELHLPPDHGVDDRIVTDIARRCVLTGGQIRNAVLHAWLLARGAQHGESEDDTRLTPHDIHAAIRREYRKMGATCPLPGEWLDG